MSDAAWSEQLDRLQENTPGFVERFIAELRRRALYDHSAVSEEDLIDTAEQTMRMLIERLRTGEISRSDFAESLGRRRARQGVPMERLIDAIRLDLRIIWQLLLEQAAPGGIEVLVAHVELLMTVVDGFVADVQQAFLSELAILQRDSRVATEQHLSKLFNARSLSDELLEEIATGIKVKPNSSFELILMPDALREHRRREVEPWLARRDVFGYMFRGWLLLFRPRGAARSSWPKDFATLPAIYVHSVDGLHLVPTAARAAVDLQAQSRPLRRLTEIDEFWAVGAAHYLDSLIPGYFPSILEALSDIAEDERERLLRTVQEFLDCGSVKETAEIVGCHRNTVINRFRLFEAQTGFDVTVPAQAALVYVMLSGITGETTGKSLLPRD